MSCSKVGACGEDHCGMARYRLLRRNMSAFQGAHIGTMEAASSTPSTAFSTRH